MKMLSLNQRIIYSASVVLLIFITLTAAALNRAYEDSSENALDNQLSSQLFALMAAAEVDDEGITMPSDELDALLGLPSSGIYAFITNKIGETLWQSSSVLTAAPPAPVSIAGGVKRFDKVSFQQHDYYRHAYGVNWAYERDDKTHNLSLTFNIITDLADYNEQLKSYRSTLWGWLLAMALLLLVTQAIILRWGLLPLRQVSSELSQIESGNKQQIEEDYPQEIARLSNNINQLLQQEHKQKTRYRNALGDLAHSLKTPLAVLQSNLNNSHQQQAKVEPDVIQQQLNRMSAIVEYQLQRAATSGAVNTGKAINLKTVTERIVESMQKVYRDKNLSYKINISEQVNLNLDEGDLLELLGNLIDNASKWSKSQVQISCHQRQGKNCISVEDDGPGIETEQIESLLQRGTRADENTDGHGIGLSIVNTIVAAYDGELHIETSLLGGARISLLLSQ